MIDYLLLWARVRTHTNIFMLLGLNIHFCCNHLNCYAFIYVVLARFYGLHLTFVPGKKQPVSLIYKDATPTWRMLLFIFSICIT